MKIVFVIASTNDTHAKNRIQEFISNGFEVEVYGYDRKGRKQFETNDFNVVSLGQLTDQSYYPRIKQYIKDFLRLKKKYDNKDVIFYLNSMDLAICYKIVLIKNRFIYEEADLVHTYKKYMHLFEWIDKKIIRASLLTVLTSEGFAHFHFKNIIPDNVFIIANKLSPDVIKFPNPEKRCFNKQNIHFGFVGKPRFKTIYNFIKVTCSTYPNFEFDIFGGPVNEDFKKLEQYSNCHFHGFFKNPDDLPSIYSKIDLLLVTYDASSINAKYAEPNKIYEAIFFDTPIIVSSYTFLANKVKSLNIGYSLNANNDDEIKELINSITKSGIQEKIDCITRIEKKDAINYNEHFFEVLKSIQ